MEYTEDWANEYAYIKPEKFSQAIESSLAQAANQGLKWSVYHGQVAN